MVLLDLAFHGKKPFGSAQFLDSILELLCASRARIHGAKGCVGTSVWHCCCLRAKSPSFLWRALKLQSALSGAVASRGFRFGAPCLPSPLSPPLVPIGARKSRSDHRPDAPCKGGCWVFGLAPPWKTRNGCVGPRLGGSICCWQVGFSSRLHALLIRYGVFDNKPSQILGRRHFPFPSSRNWRAKFWWAVGVRATTHTKPWSLGRHSPPINKFPLCFAQKNELNRCVFVGVGLNYLRPWISFSALSKHSWYSSSALAPMVMALPTAQDKYCVLRL